MREPKVSATSGDHVWRALWDLYEAVSHATYDMLA